MFKEVLDFLVSVGSDLLPFTVVTAYQNAGVLRLGHYHRTLGPGFHWKIPFADDVNSQAVCESTQRIPPQTLMTKDGHNVTVSAVVRFQIINVEAYICLIWDQGDVLIDTTAGAVMEAVMDSTLEQLRIEPPTRRVLELVRKECNRYGFKIHKITFPDLAETWAIRLIQPLGANLAN
jgi:membrane protease subunit HflK